LVADFQPRTIHGELSDGSAVSAIDAQGTSLDFDISQQFRCRRVIVGAQVDGHQVYAAMRFRLVKGSLPLPDGEATTADGSLLRILPVNQRGEKQWFEFEPTQPATLKHFDMQVMNPVITLFSLITGNETDHRDPQVRLDADSPWMPLYEGIREVNRDGLNLLATNHLTPARFAHWIDLRKTLEALDAAALDEMHGVTIQTQVLTQVAVAEGLHRRLYPATVSTRRVPKLSSAQRKKVRHAAREAAVATLTGDQFTDHDRGELRHAVSDALAHFNEQTFRSRMQDLVEVAERAVPGITASFSDWPDAVVKVRNILVHHGTNPLNEFESFIDLLAALKYSLAWVLRTVLLDRAGIDHLAIQNGYRDWSAYRLHLANVRQHLLASGGCAEDGLQPG
jgi:hypothetical protein